ncbi:MAG: hypothetical protein ABSA12_03305 [Verrucomicrobiia bacterium]|jgi:hypothetical protein
MKTPVKILACVLWSALLAGCAGLLNPGAEQHPENVAALFTQWGEQDARLNEALGERVYDKDFDAVFSAAVTGLSDIGLAVKNMERQSGYILAEGPTPLPKDQYESLVLKSCAEINKVSSQHWTPQLGNATKSVTITVLRLGDHKTKVKMRDVVSEIHSGASNKYNDEYPPTLEAEYQSLWRALEKQIFLDENLDKQQK